MEIVGLGGLLHLPEVMDVTATLRLVDDVTANPDLIRLLTGPRWRIGPRDLALLGRRARELARDRGATAGSRGPRDDPPGVLDAPGAGRRRRRPDRGGQPARRAGEPGRGAVLRRRPGSGSRRWPPSSATCAGTADEPVLDLTRRVIATLGPGRRAAGHPGVRPDRPGATSSARSWTRSPAYVDVDGDASLSGLLAYLQAEIEQGAGLEQAVPSDREAVKLLTVHKAKGLEWEVGLPAGPDAGHLPQRPGDRQLGDQPGRAAGRPARGRRLDPAAGRRPATRPWPRTRRR